MKWSLPDDKPLTDEDCDFLQKIYCQVLPGNKYTLDLSSLKTIDKIQGYAIVLKLIDGKKLNVLILFIIWLCLTRTGNYQIHEFDWIESSLDFPISTGNVL